MAAGLFHDLLQYPELEVWLVSDRSTKTGDFRYQAGKPYQITLNEGLGYEAMLITLCHEAAHFENRILYHNGGRPHGKEWKDVFSQWLLRLCDTGVLSEETEMLVRRHARNPKASLSADRALWGAVNPRAMPSDLVHLDSLPDGATFVLNGQRTFRRITKRRTRILCIDLGNRRKYLVSAHAPVKVLKT